MLSKRPILGELDFTGHVHRPTVMSSLAWSGGPWGEAGFSKLHVPNERHNVSLPGQPGGSQRSLHSCHGEFGACSLTGEAREEVRGRHRTPVA